MHVTFTPEVAYIFIHCIQVTFCKSKFLAIKIVPISWTYTVCTLLVNCWGRNSLFLFGCVGKEPSFVSVQGGYFIIPGHLRSGEMFILLSNCQIVNIDHFRETVWGTWEVDTSLNISWAAIQLIRTNDLLIPLLDQFQ